MKQADVDHGLLEADQGFEGFCLRKLDELKALRQGWDCEAAPPIDRDIIDAVAHFIRLLPERIAPRPMIVPLISGKVQLEWHAARRVLELEFESPETVHYLKWDPDHQIEDENLIPASDLNQLLALIQWFTTGRGDD